MVIPRSARYDKIMDSVNNFFLREKISSFPIDPFEIIKKNNWGLVSYSQLAEEHGVTIDNIIKAFQSKDGYVMLDSHNYTIAYNDTVEYKGRIRFTLMHEIGHIELNHLKDFDETILRRSQLTKSEYEILEREAHAFARNTLAPAVVIETIEAYQENRLSISEIRNNFFITKGAAEIRVNMFEWDLKHSSKYRHNLVDNFKNYFNDLIYGKQCIECKHYFAIRESSFCPICISQRHSKKTRGNFNMIYEGVNVDNKSRAIVCPKCENEELNYEANLCKICNVELVNKCANTFEYNNFSEEEYIEKESCETLLPGNARYCYKCGNESTYYQNNFLRAWNQDELDAVREAQDAVADLLPF